MDIIEKIKDYLNETKLNEVTLLQMVKDRLIKNNIKFKNVYKQGVDYFYVVLTVDRSNNYRWEREMDKVYGALSDQEDLGDIGVSVVDSERKMPTRIL